jgi:hypothetical protein
LSNKNLIKNKRELPDSYLKITFLIFMGSFFDFNEFILQTYYLPKIKDISNSLDLRLRSSLILTDAILCYYLLNFEIYKHQKLSLYIILSCFIIVIISEFFFEQFIKEGNGENYIIFLLLTILNYIFNSFLDVIEKYLLEVDYLNTHKLVMLEGMFGIILTSIYSIVEDPFKEIKIIYDNDKENFILLIFFFLIFFITSGGRNIYCMITNKLYSPMVRALTDSFLDPFFVIYYFIFENDFNNNILYFIINLLISIIIVFWGCIYNELLVFFCCDLQYETYHQISRRASETNIEDLTELSFDVGDNYYTTMKE